MANPEVLTATWWVGITTGLIGLIVMIYVVAARPSLPGARDDRPPMDDIDAELFRILTDARLGDTSTPPTKGPKQ